MALNSFHGSSLSSASAGVLTTSRLPPPPPPPTALKATATPKRSGSYEDPIRQNNHQRQPCHRELRQRTAGVAEYPNTSGKSPAQLLLGRPLSSFILTHRRDFDGAWTTRTDSADSVPGEQLPPIPKTSGRILPNLPLGTHVDIQDPTSKLWTRRGVIVGIGGHRDYNVKLPSGRILWRNCRYLRPWIPAIAIPSHDQPAPTPSDSSSASRSSQPRRSNRRRQPPTRLNIANTCGQSYV